MLTDLQRDILIKSAEGIQEGMWCKGEWFSSVPDTCEAEEFENVLPDEIFESDEVLLSNAEIDNLSRMYRCAEGELMFRTLLLGGKQSDYLAVEGAVHKAILENCEKCSSQDDYNVFDHNDVCMLGLDPFTAGQQWSEIFRSVL